jgi:hypothetical protein
VENDIFSVLEGPDTSGPTPPALPVPPIGPPSAAPAPTLGGLPESVQKALPVEKGKLMLDKIFRKGGIFKLSIGYWYARRKLRRQDLNLKKEEVPEEIVQLGQKRLVKKSSFDEIKSIEGKARSIVEGNSHESWVTGLRFMTLESLKKVKEELNDLQKKFFEARDKFVGQYPTLKEQMIKEFPEWAEKLAPLYPTPEKVRDSFYMKMDFFEITLARKEAEILAEAEVAIQQELAQKLNDFISSTVKDTRQLFLEELATIKEKIDKGEKVHGKTWKKINEMIEQAKQMDMVGDQDFLSMLDQFKKVWDKDKLNDEALKKQATEQLQAIISEAGDQKKADAVVEKYYRGIVL